MLAKPTYCLVVAAVCVAHTAAAQVVHGVMLSAADSQPVPYGTVRAIAGADTVDRFTNRTGEFALGDLANGTVRLRARMLGYAPLDTTVTVSAARAPIVLRIKPLPFRLTTVAVKAKLNGCVGGIPTEAADPELAAIFDQLRINVERYHLLIEKYPLTFRRQEAKYLRVGAVDSLTSIDTTVYDSRDLHPYRIGSVVYRDSVPASVRRLETQRTMMYLPTFGDLADSTFDAAHCFRYARQKDGEIQIDFRPIPRLTTPDVAGSVFLDAHTYVVRRATFDLTKPGDLQPPVVGLTVTTTFDEVVPLVPILGATRAVRPLLPIEGTAGNLEMRSAAPGMTSASTARERERAAIEFDTVLGHTFVADTVGSQSVSQPAPATPQPPAAFTIAIGCTMPPSFQTTDILIYGTLVGERAVDASARPLDASAESALAAIHQQYHLPDHLQLPVYGFAFDSKVAPTVTGEVTFTLAHGRLHSVDLAATSLSASLDTALVGSVRRADSAGGFAGLPAGLYRLSLSSATPAAGAHAIVLASLSVAVTPLLGGATIDPDSPPVALPSGTGTFEFVVDERGRAVRSTLRRIASSSLIFTMGVSRALGVMLFKPAVIGSCPIKQVVVQSFTATYRVQ
jgi:hypothetical protein